MATLEELRKQLDTIDDQIVHLYEERMCVCEAVGEYKVQSGKKVYDQAREKAKLADVASKVSPSLGVSTIIFGSLFRFGTATASINAGFFLFFKNLTKNFFDN